MYNQLVIGLGLSVQAAQVYGIIETFEKRNKICYLTNEQFGEYMKMSHRTVGRAIKELADNHIIRILRPGSPRRQVIRLWLPEVPAKRFSEIQQEKKDNKEATLVTLTVGEHKIEGYALSEDYKMTYCYRGLIVKLPENDNQPFDHFKLFNKSYEFYKEGVKNNRPFNIHTIVDGKKIEKKILPWNVVEEIKFAK